MAKNVNFKQFGSDLRSSIAKFEAEVKDIVTSNIGDLELNAIRDARPDYLETTYGQISEQEQNAKGWRPTYQAIHSREKEKGFRGEVYVSDDAGLGSVYREYGTGQDAAAYLATVDPEWREQAKRYFINGKGTIIGRPYLWPNYMKQKEIFIRELKQAIANFGKK